MACCDTPETLNQPEVAEKCGRLYLAASTSNDSFDLLSPSVQVRKLDIFKFTTNQYK